MLINKQKLMQAMPTSHAIFQWLDDTDFTILFFWFSLFWFDFSRILKRKIDFEIQQQQNREKHSFD